MSRAAARKVSAPTSYVRAQPQNVHLVPGRTRRLCGAPTGAFITLNAAGRSYLAKFLARGGGLCAECRRLHEEGERHAAP